VPDENGRLVEAEHESLVVTMLLDAMNPPQQHAESTRALSLSSDKLAGVVRTTLGLREFPSMCAARHGNLCAMSEPTRAEVDAFTAPTLLEFGTSWCGYCRAAQADIAEVLRKHPGVRHIRIEDGKGRPLGRSFGVKLWPTLIYLESGVEKARVVRPGSEAEIDAILSG
jgi:thioredoxin 1